MVKRLAQGRGRKVKGGRYLVQNESPDFLFHPKRERGEEERRRRGLRRKFKGGYMLTEGKIYFPIKLSLGGGRGSGHGKEMGGREVIGIWFSPGMSILSGGV